MVLLEEVVAGATEYEKIDTNLRELKKEFKEVQGSYQQRIRPLIARQEELQNRILTYLDESRLPGVKLGSTMFMREEVPVFSTREDKIEQVLKTESNAQPDVVTRKIIQVLRKRIQKESQPVRQMVGPDGETRQSGAPPVYRLRIFQK